MKRKRQYGSAALALLFASSAQAHPGISERTDVTAAVHDLGHAAQTYPLIAGFVASLGLVAGIYMAVRLLARCGNRKDTTPANADELKSPGGHIGR
jgi:hypothetical protein